MTTTQIIIFYFCLSLFCPDNCNADQQWFGEKWLADSYLLKWKHLSNEKEIQFRVEVKTKGWVSFGFSRNGKKKELDLAIGWVQNQQSVLNDFWVNEFGNRSLDAKQDWKLLSGEENATHIVLEFSRKLITCDVDNDLEIFENEYQMSNIVFGYTHSDPIGFENIGGSAFEDIIHLSLFISNSEVENVEDDVQQIDTWMNFQVPKDTALLKTAFCQVFKNPLKEKQTIVKFQPIVKPSSLKLNHHMVSFICPRTIDQGFLEKHTGSSFVCYNTTSALTTIRGQCRQPYIATSILSTDALTFPSNVGITLDPAEMPFFVMEAHLLNPTGHEINVSVSIRLWITKQPRKYEGEFTTMVNSAGAVYSNWGYIVPPQQPSFKISGIYDGYCFEKMKFEETGIYMFAIMAHSHKAHYLEVRHYRQEQTIRVLRYNHYDHNYQPLMRLKEAIHLVNDDRLAVICDVDSINLTKSFTSPHEHCEISVYYYPKIETGGVGILPRLSYETMLQITGLEQIDGYDTEMMDKIIIRKPVEYNNTKLLDFVENNKYQVKDPQKLEEIENSADMTQCCAIFADPKVKTTLPKPCRTIKRPVGFYKSIVQRKQENSCDHGATASKFNKDHFKAIYGKSLRTSLKILAQSFKISFSFVLLI